MAEHTHGPWKWWTSNGLMRLTAEDARLAFADLWKATGGDWDANQWVWVIAFKRIEQERTVA